MKCVAPSSMAWLRRASSRSTAISGLAWRSLAARRMFCPMPPMPQMATPSPGITPAILATEPQPVGMAQLMRHACSSGTSLRIGTRPPSGTTVCEEKPETKLPCWTGLPSASV